jgi:hypothetical protein
MEEEMRRGAEDYLQKSKELVETAKDSALELKEKAEETKENISQYISEKAHNVKDSLEETTQEGANKMKGAQDYILNKAKETKEAFETKKDNIVADIHGVNRQMKEVLDEKMNELSKKSPDNSIEARNVQIRNSAADVRSSLSETESQLRENINEKLKAKEAENNKSLWEKGKDIVGSYFL